jgi:hypothetical protein
LLLGCYLLLLLLLLLGHEPYVRLLLKRELCALYCLPGKAAVLLADLQLPRQQQQLQL